MLLTVLVFALVGAAAQMVDGTLGMGFGVTSATLLTLLGYSAVAASAGTHAAKMGTTFVSGISHWREGNVDFRVMAVIAVPRCDRRVHRGSDPHDGGVQHGPAVDGLHPVPPRPGDHRALRIRPEPVPGDAARARATSGRSGLIGGFVDATGGGGWGPVATPSLLTLTRHEPHRVVGTVNAAEFFVAVAASAGFLFGAGDSGVPWLPVLGLVVGGAIVAPFAARLARRAPTAILGVCVGGMVLVSNTAVISKVLGVPGAVAGLLVLGIVVATGMLVVRVHRAGPPLPSWSPRWTSQHPCTEPAGCRRCGGRERACDSLRASVQPGNRRADMPRWAGHHHSQEDCMSELDDRFTAAADASKTLPARPDNDTFLRCTRCTSRHGR